jgi:hypothetical protein
MYTTTITPETKSITIDLPDSFVGENVRLIAVVEKDYSVDVEASEFTINEIKERYSKYPKRDLSNFKFNRDDANDYE